MRARQMRRGASLLLAVLALFTAQGQRPHAQQQGQQPALKTTFVPLLNNANGLLMESPQPSPNRRIVAIQTHPDHNNNFNYFILRELAARGYRALALNYYGSETEFEEFLPPIAAAVKYARSLPGVEKVVFTTHSGGGPALTFYQEIAEKGPAACQEASRLYKCRDKGLTGLPKVDGLLLLDITIGAPHRMLSLDPAVDTGHPTRRDPALDLYASANGFDPATNTASYGPAFVTRYNAGVHARAAGLIANAQARLAAIEAGTGPYKDDEPFVIPGMAENSVGA